MIRALLVPLAVVALSASSAGAFGQCMPRDLMVKQLQELWGEIPVSWGVISSGSIVELFVAPNDGRSFSVVITDTNGRTCMLVGGHEWGKRTPPPVGKPA